ncbi:hypothetical protein HaLaN_32653, partial [Haematococcus lacustris]
MQVGNLTLSKGHDSVQRAPATALMVNTVLQWRMYGPRWSDGEGTCSTLSSCGARQEQLWGCPAVLQPGCSQAGLHGQGAGQG